MNIASKLISVIFLSSMPLFAQECASIKFAPTEFNGEEYVTVIAGHNDTYVEKYKSKKALLSKEHEYQVTPGIHTFTIEQWPIKLFKRLKRNNQISKQRLKRISQTHKFPKKSPVYSDTIQFTAERDHSYRIEIINGSEPYKDIRIYSTVNLQCKKSSELLLIAKEKSALTNKVILPDALEYRLRKLMTKIANDQNQHTIDNLLPTKLDDVIGTILEDKYVDNGKAIKILSVLPYSIASRLSLFSGDKIIRLGKHPIMRDTSTPDQQLASYFSSLYYGDKIAIEVIRDNQNVILNGEFMPTIIPETKFSIARKNQKELNTSLITRSLALPAEIRFEFEQLRIELANYFATKDANNSYIVISRDEMSDKAFGISGEKSISTNNDVGLKVLDIVANSIAEQLGLTMHDLIININNKPLNDSNIDEKVRSLNTLSEGDTISLIVQRGNSLVELKLEYTPNMLVAFDLSLDLKSLYALNNRINTLKNNTSKVQRMRYYGEMPNSYKYHHYNSSSQMEQNLRQYQVQPKK